LGDHHLDLVLRPAPDVLVSGDSSCLMHIAGLADKEGRALRTMHLAQVLRDALRGGGGGVDA
jgi:L-lactate dehydrogenase complex protein LldE